jgi:4'-phosphopantetheinyl transferase
MRSANARGWIEAPQQPELPAECVHIWRLCLNEMPFETTGTVLASDEQARASRFHFEKDRRRYVRCRTALRELLALYLHSIPSHIKLTYSPSGKPELAEEQNPHKMRFNVSHSEDMALIAVATGHNLGIDVETIRSVDTSEMSRRFFSRKEYTALDSLPEPLKTKAFFACWTRKEAFLKARGEGLGFPLSDFSVSVDPEMPPRIEEIQRDRDTARKWSLLDVHLGEKFSAALALEGASVNILTFTFRT